MTGFDGTGHLGRGPLTGRGLGPCSGGLARGRGFGRGFGMGRGFGFRRFWQAEPSEPYREPVTLSKEEQRKVLEAEKAEIKAELKAIKKIGRVEIVLLGKWIKKNSWNL